MTTKTYKLPKRFADDHWSRDCGETDKIVRETSTHYIVEMDAEGYSDMLSDADLYSDHTHFDPPQDYFGLAQSAKATVKALTAAGEPEPAQVADLDALIESVVGYSEATGIAVRADQVRDDLIKIAATAPLTYDLVAINWNGNSDELALREALGSAVVQATRDFTGPEGKDTFRFTIDNRELRNTVAHGIGCDHGFVCHIEYA